MTTGQTPQLLAQELITRGIITRDLLDTLEQDIAKKDIDFGGELIARDIISDQDLVQLKSEIYKLDVADLTDDIDQEALGDVPEHIITRYRVIPFYKDQTTLKVAIMDPEYIAALDALKFIAADQNVALQKYVISYADFNNVSKRFRNFSTEIDKALESITNEKDKDKAALEVTFEEKATQLENIEAEAPITRIVASIVKHAVDTKASDIHIEPLHKEIRVRLRIDGVLQTVLELPIKLMSALITRIKILSDLKIDETRLAQDGRFSTRMGERDGGREVDFRVSTFPTRGGEKAVLRILDPLIGDIKLEDLGVQGRSKRLLEENMAKPFGAILITGPTGSGKSTTLAAIMRLMNNDEINIVTLEDPIEYYVEGVNQSQIHEEIGYSFATGLRHILRQDPDVIMVGEIRDSETSKLATQASLTGHVVLSTLHTNDTIGVIPRLVDMGVEKYLLAPTLNLAVAQRLLRRLCDDCKQAHKPSASEIELINNTLRVMPQDIQKNYTKKIDTIYTAGAGCKQCGNKQYKGRIGIFEMLEMTDELERIILTDLSEEKLRQEAKRQGMITMFQDGILKVLEGITSVEELMQVAQSQEGEDAPIPKETLPQS